MSRTRGLGAENTGRFRALGYWHSSPTLVQRPQMGVALSHLNLRDLQG